jgi:competence protein ComEA
MSAIAERLKRIGPRRAAVFLAAITVGALVVHAAAGGGQSAPIGAQTVQVQPLAPSTVLVFVSGAVAHPGLYRLSASARVADAIAAAGGVTSLADAGHLPNLSALVHDGRQVNVPFVKSTSVAARLDINSAAVDELAAVPGMPDGLPEAIVQFRAEWGDFTSLSQLHTDLGVDPATVAGLRHYLRLVPPALAP